MLKNYFKIAWRTITRHKGYTFINVAGLVLGICACIVIYLIASYEFSFDAFHPDKSRIYRVVGQEKVSTGEIFYQRTIPSPVPSALREELSGFEAVTGFYPYWAAITIRDGVKKPKNFDCKVEGSDWWTGIIITERQYFDIFKYEWLAGNSVTALELPYKLVLSETKARKYFPSVTLDKIIGREVVYNDSLRVHVSGIVKDWNKNTDFPFTDFISFSTITASFLKPSFYTNDWKGNHPSIWSFVKLSKGTAPNHINTQFEALIKKHMKDDPSSKFNLHLQPLSDIHFNADYREDGRKANKSTLYSLMLIALFILIIAVVNFINLSTVRSIQRAKEIGVRKVLGSSRTNLIFQFLTETFVFTFLAVFIAVLLVNPILSAFHSFIPDGVTFDFFNYSTFIFLLLVTLGTSLLAGLYPAKVLSSYLPVLSLKGAGVQKGSEKWYLRKGLTVFQFAISLIFIIGTIIISNQLSFIRNKDLGLNTDAIINVETSWQDSLSKVKVLAQKIRQLPDVKKVALEILPPIGAPSFSMRLKYDSKNAEEMIVLTRGGNEDFIPLYQMHLLAGRNLMPSDSLKEFVINETYAKVLGFSNPEKALGKFLYSNNKAYPIIGVVADFHEYSFHEPIKPTVIANIPKNEDKLAIKLITKGKTQREVRLIISKIEKQWKEVYPNEPFEYSFLDESINRMYEKEEKTATLMNVSMIITIFISCMGLFGLAMFTSERRSKEIGIRKVLGASFTDIATMLSKDFVILVMIALLIASPFAWYFMNQWLQSFAYRVNISWWVFVEAGSAALLIAMTTVSFQAIKAAIANPVKSLRTE